MKNFNELKKNLKKDLSGHKKINIAILGDTSTQILHTVIKATCIEEGFDATIYETDFDQIEIQAYNKTSDLYASCPDYIVLFFATQKLQKKFYKTEKSDRKNFSLNTLNQIISITNTIHSEISPHIIIFNFPEINDQIYGSFGSKYEASFLFQLRKLNHLLSEKCLNSSHLHICDLSTLQNQLGRMQTFHSSTYVNADMVFSLEMFTAIAKSTIDIINSLQGKIKKCIIIDLDNTIWGGIIGDDGIENIQIGGLGIGKAFTDFQSWLKELQLRGIILAVCSKNNETTAKDPFLNHPDMVLKINDISVFVANWENKASNIRNIQKILNIGFDSIVFLDDNPYERNMVRENIQGITVPELPEDPADYLEYLYSLNLFETTGISEEDGERTKQYQTEALRFEYQKIFINEDDFIKNLEMKSRIENINAFNVPRAAQLSQRSNQFNLRTLRYAEHDLIAMIDQVDFHPFCFYLEDKFGDHGMISLVILKSNLNNSLFIESWMMSCRVLKRGMENFILNVLVEYANSINCSKLVGEFIPSQKNEIVKDHYLNLGFQEKDKLWFLDTNDYIPKQTQIQKT